MTAITLRTATIPDAPALTDVIRAAYAPFQATIPDLPDVAAGIADDIRDHSVWVAVEGAEIAGGLVLRLSEEDAVLANLAVRPASAGMGIARQLVETAETAAAKAGHAQLRLITHRDMAGTIGFCHRLGWAENRRECAKVHMTRDLRPSLSNPD